MALKDIFTNNTSEILESKKIQDIDREFESYGFTEEVVKDKNRFEPAVDFTTASNFARYGSAEKYYSDSIDNICFRYPYDGSSKEKQEWRNNSSLLDNYIFDNIYPKNKGYIKLSGSIELNQAGTYVSSSNHSYIILDGGPISANYTSISQAFTKSNIVDSKSGRGSNLAINQNGKGNTVEFWLKQYNKTAPKQCIFDIWNQITDTNQIVRFAAYLRTTAENKSFIDISYNTPDAMGGSIELIGVDLEKWNFFSIVIDTVELKTKVYVNGILNNTFNDADNYGTSKPFPSIPNNYGLKCTIGCHQSGTYDKKFGEAGLFAYIDEFRYWKEARDSKKIGRFWFTTVNGGSNTDDGNSSLGVYYKFNEGINYNSDLDSSYLVDAKVLDYSGRINNGLIQNYQNCDRILSSAIEEYSSAYKEEPDPIVYSSSKNLLDIKQQYAYSGSIWDHENNSSILKSLPTWITEEQENSDFDELKNITQVIANYFDTLHLQIENLTNTWSVEYSSKESKPIPFMRSILSSHNFKNYDLFTEASALELFLSRNEKIEYEKSLLDVKNLIYKNIYNNLLYIYKSKGTEKSIRNLMRCFGIDEQLLKINLYADRSEYKIENSYESQQISKKYIDFNNINRFSSYVTSSLITGIKAPKLTLQTEAVFPLKVIENKQQEYNDIYISILGVHGENDNDLKLQITAEKIDASDELKFKLYGSVSNIAFQLTTAEKYKSYDNDKWNFAVRIKPEKFPYIVDSVDKYIVEFLGYNSYHDHVINFFTESVILDQSVNSQNIFSDKYIFIGSSNQISKSILKCDSDIKISSIRLWNDYITDEELREHSFDPSSYGRKLNDRNSINSFPSQANEALGTGQFPVPQTLLVNYDFDTVTSSDDYGMFEVKNVTSNAYSSFIAKGHNFPVLSDQIVNKEYFLSYKLQEPEKLTSQELIKILDSDDTVINKQDKPITYIHSIEKSMSQIVNDEILKWFATIDSFNNLFGEPVDFYNDSYGKLSHLRKMFFERVSNEQDFERFFELYKWIDSSISKMLIQLVPASSNLSENIRNVIENNILTRNKIKHNLPLVSTKERDLGGAVAKVLKYDPSPRSPPSDRWSYYRAERNSPWTTSGDAATDEAREKIRIVKNTKNNNYVPRTYDYNDDTIHSNRKDITRMFSTIVDINSEIAENFVGAINPVNIQNIQVSESSNPLNNKNRAANYNQSYEVFSTVGRKANNLGLADIQNEISGQYLEIPFLNYKMQERTLPERPLVKSIIVERFSAPGGKEVSSRGSLDIESEEYSAYNGMNIRNLAVRNSYSKILARTSSKENVNPYHDVPKNTYTYKNESNSIKTRYDNFFISHQIPLSDDKYYWISCSIESKPETSYYFTELDNYRENINFFTTNSVQLNNGEEILSVDDTSNFIFPKTSNLNKYLLSLNGPYQGASWKLSNNGENKVVKKTRLNNKYVIEDPTSSTGFATFEEPPIQYNSLMRHELYYGDKYSANFGLDDNISVYSQYENNINMFSNEELNKKLNLGKKNIKQFHDKIKQDDLESKLSRIVVGIEKSETLFPLKEKVGLAEVRTKPNYDDINTYSGSMVYGRTFWKDEPADRARMDSYDIFNSQKNSLATISYRTSEIQDVTSSQQEIINSKESIYATDTIYNLEAQTSLADGKFTFNIKYNDIIKGNLSNPIPFDHVTNTQNCIAYPIDNIAYYDTTSKNLYNIRKDIDNISLFLTSSTPEIHTFLSTSSGIYIGGKFEISSSVSGIYRNLALWNGTSIAPVISSIPILDTYRYGVFKLLQSNGSIYLLGNGVAGSTGDVVLRSTGTSISWNNTNCPSDISQGNATAWPGGIIVSARTDLGNLKPWIYNGSSWYPITLPSPNSSSYTLLSASEGLYVHKRYAGGFDDLESGKLLLYKGSLVSGSSDLSNPNKWTTLPNITTESWSVMILCMFSGSDGLYVGGNFAEGIKKWNGTTYVSLNSGIDSGEVRSILSNSSGVYIAGNFWSTASGTYLNGFGRWDGSKWNFVGANEKRGGLLNTDVEFVNTLYEINKQDILCGGRFKYLKSGPRIKDYKNKKAKIYEGYKNNLNIPMPHPQIIFNNNIPMVRNYKIPFGANFAKGKTVTIDHLTYNSDSSYNISTYSGSDYGIINLNNGYIYEVDKISGKAPFYDSYEKFTEDIKPINQKYSIIPEYRISDFINTYAKSNDGFNYLIENYLSLDGSKFNKNFSSDKNNKINFSDEVEVNKFIKNSLEVDDSEVTTNYITLKVSAIKKFKPSKDFYPSERIVTLSKYFFDSFLSVNLGITSSFNLRDQFDSVLSNNTPINGQLLTLMQPLFSPGILMNTIKSSIAVDWPVYIESDVSYDSKSFPSFYSYTSSNRPTNYSFVETQFINPETYTTSSFIPVNYLTKDPTFRLPFTALLEFDSIIPKDLKRSTKNLYYLNPSIYCSDVLNASEYTSIVFPSYNMGTTSANAFKFLDRNYKLAMHNFLAEIPNFYLEKGLTKFISGKGSVNVVSGTTYSMEVVLEKSDAYKSFLTDPHYENKKSVYENFFNDTYMIPSADSLYGPPSRYWVNFGNSSLHFNNTTYGYFFKTIDTPAYAPYVPPYYYGPSVANITFKPDRTGNWSVEEILKNVKITYSNETAEELFKERSQIFAYNNSSDNYSSSPAYKNMMMLSSSVDLLKTTTLYSPTFNDENNIESVSPTQEKAWVIQTKFETPSINFADADLTDNIGLKFVGGQINEQNNWISSGVYTTLYKGLWTTYGKPAEISDGITLRIQSSNSDQQSLANLLEFESVEKQIGSIKTAGRIYEAVVLIPSTQTSDDVQKFYRKQNVTPVTLIKGEKSYFIKILPKVINKILGIDIRNKNISIEQITKRLYSTEVDADSFLIKQMKAMIKYVLPPHLDWIRNRDIQPFVMFISEFSVDFDKEDYSDMWQGLMPKPSMNAEVEDIEITERNSAQDDCFGGKELPDDLRFKIFKIKQRANINYYKLTEDSADDSGFKFTFNNSKEAQIPTNSYNWPYDFCSVVENVNTEITITKVKSQLNRS